MELKDSKLAEYEMEIVNLEDDRNQLRSMLNSLNEEMIKYKKESRQWKNQYNATLNALESLQIDYENIDKQRKFEQTEHEKKTVKIKQNELELKECHDQIKQMRLLKEKYTDIQYEIAGKDEHIQRLKAENEQLRNDLNAENNESTKNNNKVRILSKKLDKSTTKNAKLQSQIDEFEDRITDSVARPLYNELQKECNDYRQKLEQIMLEHNQSKTEIIKLNTLQNEFRTQVDKLSAENESFQDEISQLSTHNTFWKNKVKSMREEIKKLHSQPMQPQIIHNNKQATPSPSNSIENIQSQSNDDEIYDDKLKNIEKEKDEALKVINQLKKALNVELQKSNNMAMKNKILNSHTTEEVKTLIRKNNALKVLANELSDRLADKEQNIMHLKKVMKLLGNRVTELEKTNKTLTQSLAEIDETDLLQNVHALENNQPSSSQKNNVKF